MPYARDAFERLGDVVVRPGREIDAADVREATLLATRSTTQVNRQLLDGSSVRFVGTATIGTDHLDTDYLESRGIAWCYSPGCNANSVGEYVTTALLCLSQRHGFQLEGKTIGVVGVGNVGTRVVEKAAALGMRILRNDPPRERAESGASLFVSLPTLLSEADVVTLHVPLTHEGEDRTFQMADASFFDAMKPGAVFVNAARGAVVNTDALLAAMDKGQVSNAAIDTWEGEPDYRLDLLPRVDLATPHTAGHSYEGKVMGTVMVYREACRFLGREDDWDPFPELPPPPVPEIALDAAGLTDEAALWHITRRVYDIETDDQRLRAGASPAEHAAAFDRLRSNYPMRREFRFTRVTVNNPRPSLMRKIGALGFAMGD